MDSISNVIGASIRPTLKEVHIDKEPNVECPFSADLVFSPKSPVSISPSLSFILFVNGRLIQHTRIRIGVRRVLEQYYYCSDTNAKSRNQNTLCFLSVWIDPSLIDVNVHPNKREICFLDEDYVVRRVVNEIESAVEREIDSQSIGCVLSARGVKQGRSPVKESVEAQSVAGNKKIRVDYSQRTLNWGVEASVKASSSSVKVSSSLVKANSSQERGSSSEKGIVATPTKGTAPDNENNTTPSKGNFPSQTETPSKLPLSSDPSGLSQALEDSWLSPNKDVVTASRVDASDSSTAPSTPSKPQHSFLSDYVSETPYKPSREDLQLDSVLSLCNEIKRAGELCTHERDVLQKSVFISCLNGCLLSVVQYENTLLLLQNGPLL